MCRVHQCTGFDLPPTQDVFRDTEGTASYLISRQGWGDEPTLLLFGGMVTFAVASSVDVATAINLFLKWAMTKSSGKCRLILSTQ